jgi:4'-phosphopantetheinyl transferase
MMNALIEWAAPPSDLSIEHGAVHVWSWDFKFSEGELHHYMDLLSPEEQCRLQRFRFERDRIRYAISHAILRILLGRYLGLQPTSIGFTRNRYGKPDFTPVFSNSKLRFNLSHTNSMALLAIASDLDVGVDVEEIRPIDAEIADRYFSEREKAELRKLTGTEWLEGFYNCWTRKEAILKAEGIGLNVKLDGFDVTLQPGAAVTLLGYHPTAGLTLKWHLTGLQPGLGFAGALATSSGVAISRKEWAHPLAILRSDRRLEPEGLTLDRFARKSVIKAVHCYA